MDKIITIRFKETELPILNTYMKKLEEELPGLKIETSGALKRALIIAASKDPIYNKKNDKQF